MVAEGKFLFVSGQIPINPMTGKVERGSLEEQTELTLNNVKAVVEAGGGKIENVVSCRVYLQVLNPESFAKMNQVYSKFFGSHAPTRTTIGCNLLGFDIEIDCVVVL